MFTNIVNKLICAELIVLCNVVTKVNVKGKGKVKDIYIAPLLQYTEYTQGAQVCITVVLPANYTLPAFTS